MVSVLPTGTVTFLFTDIEGSTKLLARLGDGASSVFDRHDRLLEGAVENHGGTVVRTEGDAVFAVFTSAAEAVEAAVDGQRALQVEPWGFDGSVWVRMGLHTGQGALSGADYHGLDAHRAARIAGIAHGGQILVSEATHVLVAGRLPPGVRLRDLGLHRLKDLDGPERLYQVTVEDLRADFPPLHSLEAVPNNLPVQLTSFIGREEEVAMGRSLLGEHRLVTLTGPGGTGKTRLALQIASEALGDFEGVFFVPLATIFDPDLVAPTIVATLGISPTAEDPVDRLVDHLAGKRWLLILDNYEQVMEAAPLVTRLLASCPELRVLVTSRGPLHVAGERELAVPPLPVPDLRSPPDLDRLRPLGSVRLFVERAAAGRPGFTLVQDNAAAVAEIAARLDGLPLAIELAAARTRLLPPRAIADRLSDQLGLLSKGGPDMPERQQTMRAAIDWSYDLLDESARRLFRRAGAFMGGATLEAIERVCDEADALDVLTDLVDHGLVGVDPESGRFSMLEPIRQYAIERLEASGEAGSVRDRHLQVLLELAEEAGPRLTTFEHGVWLDRLEAERDNLRAALSWAIASRRADEACRLVASLWRFWHMRGPVQEGRERVAEVLALPSQDAGARLHALEAAGGLAYWRGDMGDAGKWYGEALRLAEDLGDPVQIANAEYNLVFPTFFEAGEGAAFELLEKALRRYEQADDRSGAAKVLWGRGALLQLDEDAPRPQLEQSLEDLRAALAAFERLDDAFMLGWAHRMVGTVSVRIGLLEQARHHLDRAISIFEPVGDNSGLILLLRDLAELALAEGDHGRGLVLAGALGLHRQSLGLELTDVGANRLTRLDEAVAKVGADRADVLFERGRRLSLAEAIRYTGPEADAG